MSKTGFGTGAFAFKIFRGTLGTTSDAQDLTVNLGTQTASADSMVVDVTIVVTTSTAYYYSIIPVNKLIGGTGFGVPAGPTGYQSGTITGVPLDTASLKFGLGFSATTGTPTITIPMVQANAFNLF